jgi:uncharacterized protein (TIGR03437 family)
MRLAKLALLFTSVFPHFAPAQTLASWDGSGNGMLKGAYFFRNVVWYASGNTRGDLLGAIALYGTLNFDGNGNYTATCQVQISASALANCPSGITGIYRVSAGGFARIASIAEPGEEIDGLVSNGVLVASSTDPVSPDHNDLLIAAQASDPPASAASVNGKYWAVDFDTPSSLMQNARSSTFALNFDGAGNIGTVDASGYIGSSGATVVTQSVPNVRYSFANGVGTLNFGNAMAAQSLVYATRTIYTSADGRFVFGGLPNGFDMFVAVKAVSGDAPSNLANGFYYTAGLIEDESQLSAGITDFRTYFGAFNANGSLQLGHQRPFSTNYGAAFDYTYARAYSLNADATYDDGLNPFRNIVGAGGDFQVGAGKGPFLGISVALKAPSFSGSGVYLNPTGVVNAASYAPFTVGLSRGQLITLYGTNLSNSTLVDGSFPPSLGGVIVLINTRQAPIYVVSPTQISVQVPFSTTEATATIQVINNGTLSNSVMVFMNTTTPGVFTQNQAGNGYAAALHSADYSLVTANNPAKQGETILVYLTGMGTVNPAVNAGTPAPNDPLSIVTSATGVYIDGKAATVGFNGLAPGFVGLYQMNVQIPTGISSGDVNLEIAGPDSLHGQVRLPIAPVASDTISN